MVTVTIVTAAQLVQLINYGFTLDAHDKQDEDDDEGSFKLASLAMINSNEINYQQNSAKLSFILVLVLIPVLFPSSFYLAEFLSNYSAPDSAQLP